MSTNKQTGWLLFSDDEDEWELQEFHRVAASRGVTILQLDPRSIDIAIGGPVSKRVFAEGSWQALPDFVYPAFGGEPPYQSKAVIRHLSALGVFCLNKWQAIEMAGDKLYSLQILEEQGFSVPRTVLVKFPPHNKLVAFVEAQFGFPVVLKVLSGSRGKGVFFADDKAQLWQLLELIDTIDQSGHILVQEFIKTTSGRDLRVFTLGGEAIACIERNSSDPNERRAGISTGGTATQHSLTEDIRKIAEDIASVFDLRIAGVDLLFGDDDTFLVCEVNSCPGFKGIHEGCPSMNIPNKILDYIEQQIHKASP